MAFVSPCHAHHGPPHEDEDEFLSPPAASPVVKPADFSERRAIPFSAVWPALLVPAAFAGVLVLLASAGRRETPGH